MGEVSDRSGEDLVEDQRAWCCEVEELGEKRWAIAVEAHPGLGLWLRAVFRVGTAVEGGVPSDHVVSGRHFRCGEGGFEVAARSLDDVVEPAWTVPDAAGAPDEASGEDRSEILRVGGWVEHVATGDRFAAGEFLGQDVTPLRLVDPNRVIPAATGTELGSLRCCPRPQVVQHFWGQRLPGGFAARVVVVLEGHTTPPPQGARVLPGTET